MAPKYLTTHCQAALSEYEQSVPPPRKPKNKRLWVDALEVLQLTQALKLAHKAVEWTERPLLNHSKRGAPQVYSAATVLLTFLVPASQTVASVLLLRGDAGLAG